MSYIRGVVLGGEGGGAPYSPGYAQNLLAWWDASDVQTTFQDTSGTTFATTAGETVQRLSDKSGNGYHATNSTPAPTLATVGGKRCLDFTSQHLRADALAALISGADVAGTWHYSYYADAGTSARAVIGLGNTSNSFPWQFVGRPTANTVCAVKRDVDNLSVTLGGDAWRVDDWSVVTVRFNGTTTDIWHNGLLVLSGGAQDVAAVTLNTLTLGGLRRGTITAQFDGKIGEIFMVGRAQSMAEIADAQRYLLAKWRDQAVQQADLFAVAGQSNAEGRGTSGPAVDYGKAFYVSTAARPLADPVGGASTGSAWPAFVNEWHTETGRPSFWTECAQGSTAIQPAASTPNWDVATGTLYPALLAGITSAINLIDQCPAYAMGNLYINWAQGETDAVELNGTTVTVEGFSTGFGQVIEGVHYAFPQFSKFLVSELGVTNNGNFAASFDAIRAAQADVVADYDYAAIVFTGAKGFASEGKMIDTFHYSQTGLDEMGVGMAQGLAALL